MEVTLHIDREVFKVRKSLLCEYSDYFQAMFSGNYVENGKTEITIDVVDARSMTIILQYMNIGLIDLMEYSLTSLSDLAVAANFLQITELIKQIEYTLELHLTFSNWMEILIIAENASYSKLEKITTAFGLFNFTSMTPEYIPSMRKLSWYLAHPCLDTPSELDVFKFGYSWILESETGADSIMIILGCLDYKKVTETDLLEIQQLLSNFSTSLAAKVLDCLLDVKSTECHVISIEVVTENRSSLCEKFTERVVSEVFNLLRESVNRTLTITPSIPVWIMKYTKPDFLPHYMYTYCKDKGFDKWIEVAEKNLWGWSIVTWGRTKLVVCCGEYGRGTGSFMKDVKVYDTLKEEWTHHGVNLPACRHSGVTVLKDSLFIIGGVGGYRVTKETTIIYDLSHKSFRKVANFPDAIQNPAVCTHDNTVYAAGHSCIYAYEDLGETDRWVQIAGTEIRMSCMVSFKGAIYSTQNYFSNLYMFRPNTNSTKVQAITHFKNPPAAVCNIGEKLLFFTRNMCSQSDVLNAVEEYTGSSAEEMPKTIWSHSNTDFKVNDVAGSCSLVMTMPPLHKNLSNYLKKYLSSYVE